MMAIQPKLPGGTNSLLQHEWAQGAKITTYGSPYHFQLLLDAESQQIKSLTLHMSHIRSCLKVWPLVLCVSLKYCCLLSCGFE